MKQPQQEAERVFNIGYQGRSISDFCQVLAEAGVRVLVDVRAVAWSQRPQYRKGYLQGALREHGVEYVHCKLAGNPFRPKAGTPVDLERCEAMYQGHLREHPEVVDAVEEIVTSNLAALFCYEAARGQCHRGVLLSALVRRRANLVIVDL
ncbi:DUF488 domain-containing protein [Polyangium aurulentum]|uniref:DUF488 domain-containing protein n=1 Tax=Polyangium aurulentum TaxID=2567896 RepID=UPI0010ADD319|nr:DUF488 domain-containing protein [Polyangium aurulentum]